MFRFYRNHHQVNNQYQKVITEITTIHTGRTCVTSLFIHSLIHQWHYSVLLGPGLFLSFIIFFTQTVGLLGQVISLSQGRYLYTGQHKHRTNTHTDNYALSGIQTHEPSV
jgi:hypothetical protein